MQMLFLYVYIYIFISIFQYLFIGIHICLSFAYSYVFTDMSVPTYRNMFICFNLFISIHIPVTFHASLVFGLRVWVILSNAHGCLLAFTQELLPTIIRGSYRMQWSNLGEPCVRQSSSSCAFSLAPSQTPYAWLYVRHAYIQIYIPVPNSIIYKHTHSNILYIPSYPYSFHYLYLAISTNITIYYIYSYCYKY